MDVIALDVETTGLDPRTYEVIEVGLVRLSHDLAHEWGRLSIKVKPDHIERATAEALRVNGYRPKAWAGALSQRNAMSWTAAFMSGALPLGHNVDFDLRFLTASMRRAGLQPKWSNARPIDSCKLARELLVAEKHIPDARLSTCADYFGLEQSEPHRALDDALLAVEIARHLYGPAALAGHPTEVPF